MLDGLNEDLDLVLRKPPPIVSSPERDVALERLPEVMGSDRVWGEYRERNDSVIVDFFQGQFRNKVECLVDNCVVTIIRSARRTLTVRFADIDDVQRFPDSLTPNPNPSNDDDSPGGLSRRVPGRGDTHGRRCMVRTKRFDRMSTDFVHL
jgi:hypothetical protein